MFNAQETVHFAISSILGQSYSPIEIVAVNDGSTDKSLSILQGINDPRLRIIDQRNFGAGAARQVAVRHSRGTYIALQDADDISLPGRISKQVDFLEKHPTCVAVGSWSEITHANGGLISQHRHPCGSGELSFLCLFDSFFVATSVMMRRSALLKAGNYSNIPLGLEDFELWYRLSREGDLMNLPEVLVRYAQTEGSLSRSHLREREQLTLTIASRNLVWEAKTRNRPHLRKAAANVASLWWGQELRLSLFDRLLMLLIICRIARNVTFQHPNEISVIGRRSLGLLKRLFATQRIAPEVAPTRLVE